MVTCVAQNFSASYCASDVAIETAEPKSHPHAVRATQATVKALTTRALNPKLFLPAMAVMPLHKLLLISAEAWPIGWGET